MYDKIDHSDRDAVMWLQTALAKLLRGPRPFILGVYDIATRKALMNYQFEYKLPETGELDEATMASIKQNLADRKVPVR